jgi:hypothetical protein
LKGFAEPPAIGAAVGLEPVAVQERLPDLQAEELVARRDGRLSGWSLTGAGRLEQQQLAVTELADTGLEPVTRWAYERFRAINGDLLALCTDWQVRDGVVNDHADPGYDAAVIDRLGELGEAVQPIVADLAEALLRFRPYAPRLSGAVERVLAGEHDYFTKPIIDSFHTVWFELHEDLLTSLGLERSQEATI